VPHDRARCVAWLAVVVALGAVAPHSARAQDAWPTRPEGFFYSVSFGFGIMASPATRDVRAVTSEVGVAAELMKVGYRADDQWAVALITSLWLDELEVASPETGLLGARIAVEYSPLWSPAGFLSVGLGSMTVLDESPTRFGLVVADMATTFGFSVGAGYNLQFSRRGFVTPYIGVTFGPLDRGVARMAHFGLGITAG